MVQEAQLKRTESGLEPAGDGWFAPGAFDAKCLLRTHGAGVERETIKSPAGTARREPDEAYAEIPPDAQVGYRAGWLPERA